MATELKRKERLLETVKYSKAEEMVSLQREGSELKKKESKADKELEELRAALQNLNREKVNMLREGT